MPSTAEALHFNADGYEARCDYYTAYWSEHDAERFPEALATEVIHGQESAGHDRTARAAQGIDWYGAGGGAIGIRGGERFFRASGQVACDTWTAILGTHTSVSRADFAATFRLREPRAHEARDSFERWKALPPAAGQPQRGRYFVDERDGETFALGSRTSDVYLRLYDWGVAHEAEEAGCCWRYEAELKGDRATRAVALAMSATQRDLAIAAMVRTLFTDRRISFPVDLPRNHVAMDARIKSTDEKRLAWLRKQVGKPVAKLVENGRLAEVIEALGLADHVTINHPK